MVLSIWPLVGTVMDLSGTPQKGSKWHVHKVLFCHIHAQKDNRWSGKKWPLLRYSAFFYVSHFSLIFTFCRPNYHFWHSFSLKLIKISQDPSKSHLGLVRFWHVFDDLFTCQIKRNADGCHDHKPVTVSQNHVTKMKTLFIIFWYLTLLTSRAHAHLCTLVYMSPRHHFWLKSWSKTDNLTCGNCHVHVIF